MVNHIRSLRAVYGTMSHPAPASKALGSEEGGSLPLEDFEHIIDVASRRSESPEDFEALLSSSEELRVAWDALLRVLRRAEWNVIQGLRRMPSEKLRGAPAEGWYRAGPPDYGVLSSYERGILRTPKLAMLLGELARVADLSEKAMLEVSYDALEHPPLGVGRSSPSGAGADDPRDQFSGEEEEDIRRFYHVYPVAAAARDTLLSGQRWAKLSDEDPGMGLSQALGAARSLDRLHKTADPVKNRYARRSLGTINALPKAGSVLASSRVLPSESVPEAFQQTYDEDWNLAGSKGRSVKGAFVDRLRGRTASQGPPELLTVLAASSDGTDRSVAGVSKHTPRDVYEKMIYDNALGVLREVVQNPQFDDHLAHAMIDTGLPNPIVAVMVNGRVDMGIRILAFEKALENPEVSPLHAYEFLRNNTRNDSVPKGLWTDLVREMRRRSVEAEEQGDEEAVTQMQKLERRFTSVFIKELLAPYLETQKKLRDSEHTRPPRRNYRSWRKQVEDQRDFVEAHRFIVDPEILNTALRGLPDEDVLTYARSFVETDTPIPQSLMVRLLEHPEPEVRQQGIELVPHVDDEKLEAYKADLQEEARQDIEYVRQTVRDFVVPDYEPVEGVARKLNRNKHPHFLAARTRGLDDLIETYVHCYETDPRTMFDEFRRLTMAEEVSLEERIRSAEPRTSDWEPTPLDVEPVRQSDLFEDPPSAEPDRPGIVNTKSQDASSQPRRRQP